MGLDEDLKRKDQWKLVVEERREALVTYRSVGQNL
jgi:hypothetical protein